GYGFRVSQAGHLLRTSARMALNYRNAEGSLESSTGTITVSLEQPGGTMWTLTGNRQEDDLLQAFSPTPATTVPAGRYAADYLRLTLASPTGPRLVLGGSAQAGQYFDGALYSLQLTPEWRASVHFRISGDLEVARVSFSDRGERQWSRLARLKVLASATPQLSLTAVLQANSLADLATADFRLRYNLAEGHDLWVVYSHGLNLDRSRMDPEAPATARASLLVKYTRAFGR
ncbi:MAG TPA: hypothetical protein VNH46_13410, partial [Gemmatimonadales bacterium]|nr:hypothetical protein [Gemmatimonadales bacterium]